MTESKFVMACEIFLCSVSGQLSDGMNYRTDFYALKLVYGNGRYNEKYSIRIY